MRAFVEPTLTDGCIVG